VPANSVLDANRSDTRARRLAGGGGRRVERGVRRKAAIARRDADDAAVASGGLGRTRGAASPGLRAAGLLEALRCLGSEAGREGMARYGINVENAFGASVYELRRLAKGLGRDHELALALWATGNHEARVLACFVDDPTLVTERQMEAWVRGFDSWDLCDQVTTSLFDLTNHAWAKAVDWAERSGEWERRAGFALMAGLAVHDEAAANADFVELLPLVERAAFDERNFVKKAVNWALRNIGKRNRGLNAAAVACAERIHRAANAQAGGERGGDESTRAARWVATDAFRELTSTKVRKRVGLKAR